MARKKDTLFQKPYPPASFEFNEAVAGVFDDMLARSVPFYRECLELTATVVRKFARPGSQVYDIGCSTGTLMLELARSLPKSVRLVGLDNSEAMLKKARRKLARHRTRCDFMEADLNDPLELTKASVVVMNYTLQFVPPRRRGAMLRRIHETLRPGGALVLIEKVEGQNPELDALWVEAHHQFKKQQGYSKLEISRKRQALENVLVPLTAAANEKLLKRAGFEVVEPFFRWFNFAGWVALKGPDSPQKS